MAIISRQNFPAHLEYGIRVGFLNGRKDYKSLRNMFVRQTSSSGAFELYGDLGSVPWPVLNAGKQGSGGTDARTGAPVAGRINAGGPITIWGTEERSLQINNLDWEIAFAIELNALSDNRLGDFEAWSNAMGSRFEQHLDYLAFNALNSGEATTNYGAGYDGLSFFNNSHVDPGAVYTTGQDNLYALTLSLDNFDSVVVAGSNLRDGQGQPAGLSHTLLITSPTNRLLAHNITQNTMSYDTANRESNAYAGMTTALIAPGGYLDSTAWYVVDTSTSRRPLILQMRQEPTLVTWDDYSQGGGIRYFKWHARYNIGYGDWRLCMQGNT